MCEECPICYDAITVETGCAKLSCGHSYHIACITKWFSQQTDCPSSCAMCRKKMSALEDIPQGAEDVESEIDSDDESDEEDEEDESEEEDEEEVTELEQLVDELDTKVCSMESYKRDLKENVAQEEEE